MWLCVDRIESDVVILISDDETVFHVPTPAYVRLTGCAPVESQMLWAETQDGTLLSAACDEAETKTRKKAAADRLARLFGSAND
jgi:hypothetical protein